MEKDKVIMQIWFRPSGTSLCSLPCDRFVWEKLIRKTNKALLMSWACFKGLSEVFEELI